MSEGYPSIRERWTTRAGEWVLYALAWTARMLTWPIPTWTLSGLLAPIGGWLCLMLPAVRRRADANLALIWPHQSPAERRTMIRRAGAQFTRLAVEYARLDWFVRRMDLDVRGQEHLDAAKAAGKGAILVSAHYGNWEAARLAAKQHGFESGIIYRAFNNRYLDRFTMDLIPITGEPVLQKGRQGMRKLVAHVARGGVVMILVDQRNSGAPFLDFMGKPAETVTAAADLALRTGAALIPVRARRDVANRKFDVAFEEPVTGETSEAMMQDVNDRVSAWVEQHPEQWFWFHRRWKSNTRSRPLPNADGRTGETQAPGS